MLMLKDPVCLRRKQRYEAGLCLFWRSLFTGYGISLGRRLGFEGTDLNPRAPRGREGPRSGRKELLPQKGHRARTDYLFPAEPGALKGIRYRRLLGLIGPSIA
jgi:hypothetical protein